MSPSVVCGKNFVYNVGCLCKCKQVKMVSIVWFKIGISHTIGLFGYVVLLSTTGPPDGSSYES